MSADIGDRGSIAWGGKHLGDGIALAAFILAVSLVVVTCIVVTFLNAKADRIWPTPPPAPAPAYDRCPYVGGC